MTPREQEEYRALRATIRERGSMRIWVFLFGLIAWGALTLATAALATLPVATFLPLLVLAGAFEAVFQLHVGVERIGRYLQVFFESDSGGWEHAAMGFGPPHHGLRTDPLFTILFAFATLLNFVPAIIAEPVRLEFVVVGTVHLLFLVRLAIARRAAATQRSVELARFEQLKRG